MKVCNAVIQLRTPIRSERRRGFQPPWYTVFVYECQECGAEVAVRANAFRGTRPEPAVGGIRCQNLVTDS